MSTIKPYKNSKSKKIQITEMFNNIAESYDFLNHSLSLGMDNIWRKKAIKMLKSKPKKILDIATGTADFAISAAKYTQAQITGIDISEGMLKVGSKKILQKKLEKRISLKKADCEKLPFKDNSFDAITVGFGVRNFENIKKGLSEMHRVLNNRGTVVISEPSIPKNYILNKLYNIYFNYILPTIGSFISRDKNAYKYLPESVANFPSEEKFITKLETAGFKKCECFALTLGIVSLYIAIK